MSSLSKSLVASAVVHAGLLGLAALAPRAEPHVAKRIEVEVVRLPMQMVPAGAGGGEPGGGGGDPPARPQPAAARSRRPEPAAETARHVAARTKAATEAMATRTPVPDPVEIAAKVHAPVAGEADADEPLASDAARDGMTGDVLLADAGTGSGRGTGSGSGSGEGAGTGSGDDGRGVGSGKAGAGHGNGSAELLAHLRARTSRCYPRAARKRRTEGVADVAFCIDAAGAPMGIELRRSSGSPVLDDAALDCVIRGAAPLPARDLCVSVPVDFHLR